MNGKARKTGERIPIEGTFNLRDLGGYPAAGGRTVKRGLVFRSDDLGTLTDNGLEALTGLGIRTIVDFRDEEERKYAPDRRPPGVTSVHELPIRVGNLVALLGCDGRDAGKLLCNANKSFVRDFHAEYAAFFKILAAADSAPLLFHCSAGKDRAGFGAAMLLSSLGVDRETVIRDYQLSEANIRPKYLAEIEANPVLAPLMLSRRDYLESAFMVIDHECGGIEKYLAGRLKVDLENMRRIYLD